MPIYILQIHCFSGSWHCNGFTISGAVYDIIYLLVRYGKRPSKGETVSVILALVGTICLMGNDDGLSIESFPLMVLVWGLLSAIGVAVYSISPVDFTL